MLQGDDPVVLFIPRGGRYGVGLNSAVRGGIVLLVEVIVFLLLDQLSVLQEELDYAPEWVTKARYRRGQAQNGKQNFEQALADLRVVQQLQPTDAGVKKEIAALKIAAEKQRSKEKKMYSKMF